MPATTRRHFTSDGLPGMRFEAMEGGEILRGHMDGCQVSFLFRGKNVEQHCAAHDALSDAAAQAAQLIAELKARGTPMRELIYEFDTEAFLWFPSSAVLNDNRIITGNNKLLTVQTTPEGSSLGPSRRKSFSRVIRLVLDAGDE